MMKFYLANNNNINKRKMLLLPRGLVVGCLHGKKRNIKYIK